MTLNNINITFEKGKRYAVVGGSGSGKSTLTKLVLGYYNNYQGQIRFDDMDMHAISEKSVMEQVAVIPQNVYVFEDTLRNNITLFDPYTEEEVDMAVKKAGLDGVVQRLEMGLETVLKEGGQIFPRGKAENLHRRAFYTTGNCGCLMKQPQVWIIKWHTRWKKQCLIYQALPSL